MAFDNSRRFYQCENMANDYMEIGPPYIGEFVDVPCGYAKSGKLFEGSTCPICGRMGRHVHTEILRVGKTTSEEETRRKAAREEQEAEIIRQQQVNKKQSVQLQSTIAPSQKVQTRSPLEKKAIVVAKDESAHFWVKTEDGHSIVVYLSGKLYKNNIKILPGDKVVVELSPHDFSKGRLIKRLSTTEEIVVKTDPLFDW